MRAWLQWSESPDAYAAFAWCRAVGHKSETRSLGAEHAVEVAGLDEQPARLGALVAGDDPAALEHVDQAAGRV